jgi:hypothetical protein
VAILLAALLILAVPISFTRAAQTGPIGTLDYRAEDLRPYAKFFYEAAEPCAPVADYVFQGLECKDGKLSGMIGNRIIDADYDGGPVTVTVYWTATTSTPGDTVWGVLIGCAADGVKIGQAMQFTDPDVTHKVSRNTDAGRIHEVAFTPTVPARAGGGRPLVLFVGRVGSDPLDTMPASAYVVEVKIEYRKR